MLKYSVRINDNNIKKEELVWSEKYLSPDLTYITGVTSQDYHLEKYEYLDSTSRTNKGLSKLYVETENVTRDGFVVVSGKEYDIKSSETYDYSDENQGVNIAYRYIEINGKIYYENDGKYQIDNWLVYDEGADDVVESAITVYIGGNNDKVKIDTVYWMEDGYITIDGHIYKYNRDESGITYYDTASTLTSSEITPCENIIAYPYALPKYYKKVTKFRLTKDEAIIEKVEYTTLCKYFYYIIYKNHYCPIVMVHNNDGTFNLVCEVPRYILSGDTIDIVGDEYETIKYQVYLRKDGEDVNANSENLHDKKIFSLQDVGTTILRVYIDDAWFPVQNDILNSNGGRMLAIHLEGQYVNAVKDERVWYKTTDDETTLYVYDPSKLSSEYDFNEDDKCFVVYNGIRYNLIPNLCDKAVINGEEYDIDYVNGKSVGNDCFVYINEEPVPMRIVSNDKVQRYGYVMLDGVPSATTAQYNIHSYSGITINGERYPAIEGSYGDYYITIDSNNSYPLRIIEVRGSSMLICEPDFDDVNFTTKFYDYISTEICREIVGRQSTMSFYVANKLFGIREITKDLGFLNSRHPISSDDYYNLFNDLVIYARTSFIYIPLLIGNNLSNNINQSNLVENDYYNEKKERSINRIVDMEKDVYTPKYISSDNGKYKGSETTFSDIREININLHFRTRNLDNWKVNEGYNLVDTEDERDNWFVTDLSPYKEMIERNMGSGDTLMNTSDLIGLLGFTNNDVFYQKSCISKSFIRLSFYDSTDPNTQSLLATCVSFMDGHTAFKRYVDNSQKYVSAFGIVDSSFTNEPLIAPKISVMTEYLGGIFDSNKSTYTNDNTKFGGVIIDDEHRIGSGFKITNKYETKMSSEGFYLYIFREYSENLTPKPIYMKVEFNHALIGKTIPFTIPMKWKRKSDTMVVPDRALTLNTNSDINELKKGYPLSYVMSQLYVPLYAVYDFKNKEYGYVFDDRYVKNEGDVLNINMFELKVMDESGVLYDGNGGTNPVGQEESIQKHKQIRAIIDTNDNFLPIDNVCS